MLLYTFLVLLNIKNIWFVWLRSVNFHMCYLLCARAMYNLWSICLQVNNLISSPCFFIGNVTLLKALKINLDLYKDHLYYQKFFVFLSLSVFVIILDLSLIYFQSFNNLVWSNSPSSILILLLKLFSLKDLIVSYCWKS